MDKKEKKDDNGGAGIVNIDQPPTSFLQTVVFGYLEKKNITDYDLEMSMW